MVTMPQQMQFPQQPNAFAQRMAPGGRPPLMQQPMQPMQPQQPWGGQPPVQVPPMGGAQWGGQPTPQPFNPPPHPFPQQPPMMPGGGGQGPAVWGGQPPNMQQPAQMPNAYARFMQPWGQNG